MVETNVIRWDDRYLQVLHRLGESSSRSTYEVKDHRSAMVYVRKTYYPRQTSCDHIKLALSTLKSSQDQAEENLNVLRCHGVYLTDGPEKGVRAVFEYCEGGSLQSIGRVIAQRGGFIGEKVAARLAEGMLQGLHYLSSLRMVHFNIQPSNVLISRSGIVKLSEPEIPGEGAAALTDRFANSVRYASPERIRGHPANIYKSDIWAMGITLLELVQNRYPYPEDLETVQLMVRIVEGHPPMLQDRTEVIWGNRMKEFFRQTLSADEVQRPIAWELLAHPWITGAMQQNVSMERWIAEVRGWPLRR
ncbi:kinase-like domain-containing protein [Crepidotus variabilis]|uniref:mitogen-activated protein kinase kinase n=1 Tax=Crepidotus variabilis TaxID=179855 RepID=A0A9P6EKT5_9AGAR|nr:kinase-like domain-containing protein [Crepidotus variabilis]